MAGSGLAGEGGAADGGVGLGVEDVAVEGRRVAGLGEALLDQVGDLAAVDRLLLEQRLGDQLEAAAVLVDQLGRPAAPAR